MNLEYREELEESIDRHQKHQAKKRKQAKQKRIVQVKKKPTKVHNRRRLFRSDIDSSCSSNSMQIRRAPLFTNILIDPEELDQLEEQLKELKHEEQVETERPDMCFSMFTEANKEYHHEDFLHETIPGQRTESELKRAVWTDFEYHDLYEEVYENEDLVDIISTFYGQDAVSFERELQRSLERRATPSKPTKAERIFKGHCATSSLNDGMKLRPTGRTSSVSRQNSGKKSLLNSSAETKGPESPNLLKKKIDFLDIFKRNPKLNWHIRNTLIDWMKEFCQSHSLKRNTFYLALAITDHYLLTVRDYPKSEYQLLGALGLYLASKHEVDLVDHQDSVLRLSDFRCILRDEVGEEEAKKFEVSICKVIGSSRRHSSGVSTCPP